MATKGGEYELAGNCLSQLQLKSEWAKGMGHVAPETSVMGGNIKPRL